MHLPRSYGNLHTTPLHQNQDQFSLPRTADLCSLWGTFRNIWSSIAVTVTICVIFFKVIGKLQRKDYVVAFSRNGQMCGWFLQSKSWVVSSLSRHHSHRAWSVVCIFHVVKISYLTEVSVTEMSDTVFQGLLEINAHVHTEDTRCSFFPFPFSAPGKRG